MPANIWIKYKKIKFQKALFDKGIIAGFPKDNDEAVPQEVSDLSFELGTRKLKFFHPADGQPAPSKLNSTCELLENIFSSTHTNKIQTFISTGTTEKQLRQAKTAERLKQGFHLDQVSPCIINTQRTTEIFLPVSILAEKKEIGLYIYPWSSTTSNETKFPGFKQYITAGCLFGSSLKGQDQKFYKQPLIKHDLDFFPGQQIIKIIYDSDDSPYEKMLFSEFEKTAAMIAALGGEKKLLYHLPYYDYVLFGIDLFLKGRISSEALDSFFEKIYLRKEEHEKRINEICKKHNIEVTIECPFINIFPSSEKISNKKDFAKNIHHTFFELLSTQNVCASQDEKTIEKNIIEYCLEKLQKNAEVNSLHAKVWKDFIAAEKKGIRTLDDLFKIANAVMVGVATSETKDHETCSILPISEKPIQVQYVKSTKELSRQYPPVANFSTLDSTIGYSDINPEKNGLLFYYCQEEAAFAEALEEKLLENASRNICAFARQKPAISLEQSIEQIALVPPTKSSAPLPHNQNTSQYKLPAEELKLALYTQFLQHPEFFEPDEMATYPSTPLPSPNPSENVPSLHLTFQQPGFAPDGNDNENRKNPFAIVVS